MENNERAYNEAKKKVKKLKGFYQNLVLYVVVSVFMVGLNLYQNPKYLWSLWIVFSWGFALVMQAIGIFLPNIFFSKQWEERKIKEFLEK